MKLLVITTGGTIGALRYPDPLHHPEYSSFPPTGTCYVRRALLRADRGLAARDRTMEPLPPRDSKRIDAAYRAGIVRAITRHPLRRVLITHGTDALLKTAAYLYRVPGLRGRTVVLTGAMLPLANGASSDGGQNLRYAVRRLMRQGRLPPGIYLVLSDYSSQARLWQPKLYRYVPGMLAKYYDPDRADRSRLMVKNPRMVLGTGA